MINGADVGGGDGGPAAERLQPAGSVGVRRGPPRAGPAPAQATAGWRAMGVPPIRGASRVIRPVPDPATNTSPAGSSTATRSQPSRTGLLPTTARCATSITSTPPPDACALAAVVATQQNSRVTPGARITARGAELPEQLTRREAEIAQLAAQSMRDKDIADELVLSVRTVESHLATAYRKLGIASRRELVEALGNQPHTGSVP